MNTMSQYERADEEDNGRNGRVSAAVMLAEEMLAGEPEASDGSPGGAAVGLGDDGAPPRATSADAAQECLHAAQGRPAPGLSVPEDFKPWHHELTELGDARRLKDAFGLNVRWVKQKKAWIVYDGGRWHGDETGGVLQQGARQMVDVLRERVRTEEQQARTRAEQRRQQAGELTRRMERHRAQRSRDDQAEMIHQFAEFMEATGSAPGDGSTAGSERKAWTKKCQSRRGLQNMVSLLQDEPGIAVNVTEQDKDPDLLGVVNGVVDLRTGQLRAAGREDLVTRTAATLYDPAAEAPLWQQYLEAVQPDPEFRAFLARAIGYSLTGHTREQRFFVLHGDGSTGKTTFIEAIRFVLGEYAVGLPASSLTASKQGAIPNDLARICGARFVPAAETNEFQRMDEALIKRLSGSDTIEARFLNKEFFSFPPTHKLWIATNHLPHVQDTGNGFWRRPVLIPFNQKFAGDTDDKRLRDKLKAEAPGILAWAVRQCLEWQREGLNVPPHLTQSVQDYRTEQDIVARFVADRCDVGDGLSAPADSLYQAYREWTGVQGENALTGTAFGKRLNGLGYIVRRSSNCGLRCGLKLSQPQHQN